MDVDLAQVGLAELLACRADDMEPITTRGECSAEVPNLKVVFRVLFNPDGSVAAEPALVAASSSPYGPALAETAKQAILSCQPFTMLRPDTYEKWKDIEIAFDPRQFPPKLEAAPSASVAVGPPWWAP